MINRRLNKKQKFKGCPYEGFSMGCRREQRKSSTATWLQNRSSTEGGAQRRTKSCERWLTSYTGNASTLDSTSKPSPVVLTMRPRCSVIFGFHNIRPDGPQPVQDAFLVSPDQPRIPRHIGGENWGKTAGQ
jgi:hypothetical protein